MAHVLTHPARGGQMGSAMKMADSSGRRGLSGALAPGIEVRPPPGRESRAIGPNNVHGRSLSCILQCRLRTTPGPMGDVAARGSLGPPRFVLISSDRVARGLSPRLSLGRENFLSAFFILPPHGLRCARGKGVQ